MKKKYFIIKVFYLFFIFLSFLLTNSCAYFKIKQLDKIDYDKQSLFNLIGLEYKKFANYELYDMHDEIDANYFAFKGLMAIKEKKIFIEKPEDWKIEDKYKEEAMNEYRNINEILNSDLIYQYPLHAANIVVGYDCWLEQLEENWQLEDIAKCKSKFKDGIYQIKLSEKAREEKKSSENINLEKKFAESGIDKSLNRNLFLVNPVVEKIVFFGYDNYFLRDTEISKLNVIIDYAKNNILKTIVIYGHTDTKGSKKYNLTLSLKRAKAVKKILLHARHAGVQ